MGPHGEHDDVLRTVLAVAERQHGAISLAQLRSLGCTRARLRRLVDAGVLAWVAPRVYGVAGPPPTFERRTHAALLGLGPGAVVSHLAAARLHGLVDVAEPEFTVPRSRRNAACRFVVHATDSLADTDRTVIDGLACTTVARTLRDLTRAGRSPTQLPALDAERQFLGAIRRAGLPIPVRDQYARRPTFRFPAGVVITLGPTATDWPAIAEATRRALLDAGWLARSHTARRARVRQGLSSR